LQNLSGAPKFPKVSDLSDLTDGVAITSVISLYCPDDVQWGSIAFGDPPSMADSLYNIQLLQRFCKDLHFNVCHLSIEDVVYMHESIRQNVLCFLADLFVGLEVKPVIKSVQLPGVKKDRIIEVPDPGTAGKILIYDFFSFLPYIYSIMVVAFKKQFYT
jgi:hypothetical protein